jgi:hypothetical protein
MRTVRRVVKQFPVEVLHQCSSASSCMRTRIFMEEHYEYTGYHHSTPFFSEWPCAVLFSCFAIHFRCCGPLFHAFYHEHSFPAPENGYRQLSGRQHSFRFFGLFGECVCIHYFDCCLVSTFTSETQVSLPYSYDMTYKYIAIFVVSL